MIPRLNIPDYMKKIFSLTLAAFAVCARAAEPAATNAPAAPSAPAPTNNFSAAQIPDSGHAPVRVTNSVTIGGKRVTYIAETGMLPILKPDGTARASVFYVAYTRTDKAETGNRKTGR